MILRTAVSGAIIALLVAAPDFETTVVSGLARVIDGDTIDVQDSPRHVTRVRLFGIDAPESAQRCNDANNQPYNCGGLAADALQEEVGTEPVTCTPLELDRFGRTVAKCSNVRGQDLGSQMVLRGYAVDWVYFSGGFYAAQEKDAQAARRGLWVGKFTRPARWRSEQRR